MMTAKEMISADKARTARDAYLRSARGWLAGKWCDDVKRSRGYAKADVKNARKANRKLVAAKAAGSARPMTVVLNAVLPLMQSHADAALVEATAFVAKVRAQVAQVGSVEAAFPVREAQRREYQSREWYAKRDNEAALRALARQLMTDEGAEKFQADEIADARHQFLAYAFKLDAKVGECATATLKAHGSVWGESYLHVVTTDGAAACWKTQTIVNRSVYGKRFLQFPTREVNV